MENHRTAASEAKTTAKALSGAFTVGQSTGSDRHFVCSQNWHSVGIIAPRDGMWFRHDLLAAAPQVAEGRRLETHPRGPFGKTSRSRPDRLLSCYRGQRLRSVHTWGKKTGPNPTDRRKKGSKHHLITDAQGIPLATILTGANTHDVTQLVPLLDAIPPVRGKPGRPRSRPDAVQGDRAYDSEPHRQIIRSRHIIPVLAQRRTEHGSGLGVTRWVVERSLSWLHQFKKLRVRFERRSDIHEAFLKIGCMLICWNCLQWSFC